MKTQMSAKKTDSGVGVRSYLPASSYVSLDAVSDSLSDADLEESTSHPDQYNLANIPISVKPSGNNQRNTTHGLTGKLPIQAKLTIGEPNDKYEQEADRVAQQVVQQMNLPKISQSDQKQTIQREIISDENEEDKLQMKPLMVGKEGTAVTPALESSIQQERGSGQPLEDSIRKPMERVFNRDFSKVRIHTSSKADKLSRSIQAKAFTTGQSIFFRKDTYNPTSQDGKSLIAHELAHVAQQRKSGHQFIQTLKDRNNRNVEIEDLSIEQVNKYLTEYTPSAKDKKKLEQRRKEILAQQKPKTRTQAVQDRNSRIRKNKPTKKLTQQQIKNQARKVDQAKQKALNKLHNEARGRVTRGEATRVTAQATASIVGNSNDIGTVYKGAEIEVPRGHGLSGIRSSIKSQVRTEINARKAVASLSQIATTGLDHIKTGKAPEVGTIVDAKKRTLLAYGRIEPVGLSAKDMGDVKNPPNPSGSMSGYDDRGHLVPESGVKNRELANKVANIVGENKVINQHYKKAWEEAVIAYATGKKKIQVWTLHEPIYEGDSTRPSKIRHYVVIDGSVISATTIYNPETIPDYLRNDVKW